MTAFEKASITVGVLWVAFFATTLVIAMVLGFGE